MLSTRLLQSRRSRRDLRSAQTQSCPNIIETYGSPVPEQSLVHFEEKPRRYSSPPTFYDMLSAFPEEVLLYVMSFLDVADLYQSCLVSNIWRRMCTDEFIYRNISYKKFPCLQGAVQPPLEESWKKYYAMRNESFAVIGGPTNQSACMEDICGKLRAAGLRNVDPIFAQKRIPTLAELQKYSAVLVYSYNSSAFLDGAAMGDLLADYVDNGGGVVVSVFTNCNNLRNGFVKGRFLDGNYHPILPARQHDTNGKRPLTLGRIHDPAHPIMASVKTMDGGKSSFFCPGALQPDARLVADWSNGVPLVVELPKKKGTVVGMNFFPPSSDVGDQRFWAAHSDGGLLMANALAYSGKSGVFKKKRVPKRTFSGIIKSDGASIESATKEIHLWSRHHPERAVTVAQGLRAEPRTEDPDLIGALPDAKKKRTIGKIFGKRNLSKWLSFKKPTEL